MKRKFKISLSIVVMFASLGILIWQFTKKDNNVESSPELNNEYDRQQYIKQFTKDESGIATEITENESGYSGTVIENKKILLDYVQLDDMILLSEDISKTVDYLPIMSKEIDGFNSEDLEKYYDENKNLLEFMLGVSNFNQFNDILKKINIVNNSIKSVNIKKDSINKQDKQITFILEIQIEDRQIDFDIKADLNEKKIYWY